MNSNFIVECFLLRLNEVVDEVDEVNEVVDEVDESMN